MIKILVAIPLLGGLLIVQSAIVSRLPLLYGFPDLILLAIIAWSLQKHVKTAWHWTIIGGIMISALSALPFGSKLFGYLLSTGIALVLRKRIWQAPILAMFTTTFLGTIFSMFIDLATLRIFGNPLPFISSFNLIVIPSLLLNLVLAGPFYLIIGDISKWLHPVELEM